MRLSALVVGALLPLALLTGSVIAKDAPKTEPLALGEVVYDIAGPTVDGTVLSLADLEIDRPRAEAAVLELGSDLADGETVTLETKIADLPSLTDGDEVDGDAVLDFAGRVGQRFGLVPSPEKVAKAATLGDLVDWVVASQDAPILVVAWSPRCPMCHSIYDERMQALLGETGTRVLLLACNYPDKAEHVRDYLEMNDYHWNVILDPQQRITDRLGGTNTPHCFLLDADRHLRFRGGLDNDPRGTLEGAEHKDFLRNAIEAVTSGATIDPSMNETPPAG